MLRILLEMLILNTRTAKMHTVLKNGHCKIILSGDIMLLVVDAAVIVYRNGTLKGSVSLMWNQIYTDNTNCCARATTYNTYWDIAHICGWKVIHSTYFNNSDNGIVLYGFKLKQHEYEHSHARGLNSNLLDRIFYDTSATGI